MNILKKFDLKPFKFEANIEYINEADKARPQFMLVIIFFIVHVLPRLIKGMDGRFPTA